MHHAGHGRRRRQDDGNDRPGLCCVRNRCFFFFFFFFCFFFFFFFFFCSTPVLPKLEPAAVCAGMWAMYHQHGQFAMLLLSMLLTSLIVCVHTDWFEEWLED